MEESRALSFCREGVNVSERNRGSLLMSTARAYVRCILCMWFPASPCVPFVTAMAYSWELSAVSCSCLLVSAKQLSSTDWSGFDLIWKKREGTRAVREALENYVAFEQVQPPSPQSLLRRGGRRPPPRYVDVKLLPHHCMTYPNLNGKHRDCMDGPNKEMMKTDEKRAPRFRSKAFLSRLRVVLLP